MEEYRMATANNQDVYVNLGDYFELVHEKQLLAYGEVGADNIVDNIVETYKKIQLQLQESSVSNNVLLVGKVQSGKTSNLELLTALAFDNGYNVLVIYGGYDKSLLKQTTDRFKKTFDAEGEVDYDSDGPAIFTTDDSDQILGIDDEIMSDLLESEKPVIFVSMKRPVAMKKINALFNRLNTSDLKAFIIDDEGDQASLNNAKDKIKDASATYEQIRVMKRLLNDPMYLSVTATPQANIFLSDWSALKPDSIRLIQPGIGYDGADVYHIMENNIVQLISDDDHEELVNGRIPESLWEAVRYFIVASAIKRKRAQKRKDRFSDMIVHAFREVSQHSAIYTSLDSYINNLQSSFEYNDEDVETYFSEFEYCYSKYVNNEIKKDIKFEDLRDEIFTVVKKTKLILKNGIGKNTQSNENLKWHKIYIGGDLLQRGLTFSNLITTYFTRWASSGGNMDTNLQRARWFGYREKYIDLCKIFTPTNIAQEFVALSEIEDDLWDQFSDVENGLLKIDDILIRADKTRQSPTSKQRVKYKKVSFKNRWIKQKYLLSDDDAIANNNDYLNTLFESLNWNITRTGSRNNDITAEYTSLSSQQLKELIQLIRDVFDLEPFQKKALVDLLNEDEIPIILMDNNCSVDEEGRLIIENVKSRYRSLYPNTFRIKALQQGADSTNQDKINYEGDSFVLIDKDKINIQIHKILPGYNRDEQPMENKEQYMFAIYLPKEKTYFIKDE